MIDPTQFYTVQGWMISELGLKGNALAVYAIVYGFTQDGASEYAGSSRYLCEWLGCSKKTVLDTLARLTEQGHLVKNTINKNGVIFNNYQAARALKQAAQNPQQPAARQQKQQAPKNKYGAFQNVLLTEEEYWRLKREFPLDYEARIDRLSEYIASTGKSYKSHYATVVAWARRDREQPRTYGNAKNDGQTGANGIRIDPTKNDLDDAF